MKSRVTTYLLIAAVLALWGFIAWKIFSRKPDDPLSAVHQRAEVPSSAPREEHLLLDYRDPFLKDAPAAKPQRPEAAATTPKETVAVPPKKPDRPLVKPSMKYTGTIGTGGRVSYLLEYDGLQHILVPGGELGEYILTEAGPDSLMLAKGGDVFTVYLQK